MLGLPKYHKGLYIGGGPSGGGGGGVGGGGWTVAIVEARETGGRGRGGECGGGGKLSVTRLGVQSGVDIALPDSLKEAVRQAAWKSGIKGGVINVSIPDTCAKTAVLGFEDFPHREKDAVEIVRARAVKEMGAPPDAAFDHQVLSRNGGVKVLAVAASADFIKACEDAVSSAGFRTGNISIHTLNILKALPAVPSMEGDFSIVTRLDDYFSIAIFRNGVLDFYRSKALKAALLEREIASSLIAYRGRTGSSASNIYTLDDAGGLDESVRNASGTEPSKISPLDAFEMDAALNGDLSPGKLLAAIGASL